MMQLPDYDVIEWDPLLDSSDLEPIHWIKIATQISDSYTDYDGFVVLHGTDTMVRDDDDGDDDDVGIHCVSIIIHVRIIG